MVPVRSQLDRRLRTTFLCLLAAASAFAAYGLRLLLAALIGPGLPPFILFYPAVMAVAVFMGFAPGVTATACASAMTAAWVFPAAGRSVNPAADALALAIFALMGLAMSAASFAYRQARERSVGLQAELARRESEAGFETVFHNSPGAMSIARVSDGSYVDVNERFTELFGISRGELLDGGVALVNPYLQPRSVVEAARAQLFAAGRFRNVELAWKHGDRNLALLVSAAVLEAGGERRVWTLAQDVSALRRAEAEARLLNVDLERRVRERTAELEASNREMEAFAYAVSHDLRAPLRALNGFSRALVEDHGPSLPGEARVFLDEIAAASRRMGELIDALLSLSRVTRGGLQRAEVDLSALAEAAARDLERGEPGRQVAWSIEPGLRACVDERLAAALLQNLLGNAWKYTARTPGAAIRFAAEPGSDPAVFTVADNGAGFDMRHAGRLFQPFQRLHRQDEFAGLGIGLASVQRIVHRHGGRIEASGTPGAGAAFRFTLAPAREAP